MTLKKASKRTGSGLGAEMRWSVMTACTTSALRRLGIATAAYAISILLLMAPRR